MILDVFQLFFSLYGLFVAAVLGAAWLAYRTRKQASKDDEARSEAACAARVEELLRRGR